MKRNRFKEEQIIAILRSRRRGAGQRMFAASMGSRAARSTSGRRSTAVSTYRMQAAEGADLEIDPVHSGLAASIRHPGGSITGLFFGLSVSGEHLP
jgi:hypothetical protein